MRVPAAAVLALLVAGVALSGCGLDVQSPDLFKVTRVGQGQRLTLLVNDSGTIACDGGKPKPLSDRLLLQARDLTTDLNDDAKSKLSYPGAPPGGVFSYTVKVQNGTFTFPDTAARARKELSRLELFVVQAAADPCGISA